jgi:hypothetical protein
LEGLVAAAREMVDLVGLQEGTTARKRETLGKGRGRGIE